METSNEQLVKGIQLNTYVGFMNSLFLIPGIGWFISLVMRLIGKNESAYVNARGKNMANWFISTTIYAIAVGIIYAILFFMIPETAINAVFTCIAIYSFICPFIAGIKALNGEAWNYPLTIQFLK